MTGIKAIETQYKGYRFRSRLEARWAVFFDALGLTWQYEVEGFDVGGEWYLPDFVVRMPAVKFVPDRSVWFEVKPRANHSRLEIYLAGKMSGWRDRLSAHGHTKRGPLTARHSPGLHNSEYGTDEEDILGHCLGEIQEATDLFAWIDAKDAYATLAEIGYAKGLGKRVWVGIARPLHAALDGLATCPMEDEIDGHGNVTLTGARNDLWFIQELSNGSVVADTAQEAFDAFFPLEPEFAKCAALSTSGQTVYMANGDPYDDMIHSFRDGRVIGRDQASTWSGLLMGFSKGRVQSAATAARSARFGHGERGR